MKYAFSYCTFLVILSYFAGTVPFCLYCTCIRFLHLLVNTQLIHYQSLCTYNTFQNALYPSSSILPSVDCVSFCLYSILYFRLHCFPLLILYLFSHIVPICTKVHLFSYVTYVLYVRLPFTVYSSAYAVQCTTICFMFLLDIQ